MKLYNLIIVLLLLADLLFAQETDTTKIISTDSSLAYVNDSVNVREILAKEIEEIKAKQNEEDKKLQTLVISKKNEETESGFSIIEYLFVGIESILVITIGILYLRRKKGKKRNELKKLKFNISKLREEKIVCGLTNDLTTVRRQLQTIPIDYNDGGKDVIRKARQYSISKGEVYLAAKLKLLTGELK
jgi:hypothetical protein